MGVSMVNNTRLAYITPTGVPIAVPSICKYILLSKVQKLFRSTNSSSCIMKSMVYGQSCVLKVPWETHSCLTLASPNSMGIEGYSAFTSAMKSL
jgi:hypothetical protein